MTHRQQCPRELHSGPWAYKQPLLPDIRRHLSLTPSTPTTAPHFFHNALATRTVTTAINNHSSNNLSLAKASKIAPANQKPSTLATDFPENDRRTSNDDTNIGEPGQGHSASVSAAVPSPTAHSTSHPPSVVVGDSQEEPRVPSLYWFVIGGSGIVAGQRKPPTWANFWRMASERKNRGAGWPFIGGSFERRWIAD